MGLTLLINAIPPKHRMGPMRPRDEEGPSEEYATPEHESGGEEGGYAEVCGRLDRIEGMLSQLMAAKGVK